MSPRSAADVLQLRFLGRLVSVGESPQADGPRVVRELVARGLVGIAEQRDAVGAAIAEIEGHLLGGEENGDRQGLGAIRVRHDAGPRCSRRANRRDPNRGPLGRVFSMVYGSCA